MSDPINPDYYRRNGIECDDVITAWDLDYHLGSALAYILRAEYKGETLKDLRKAIWFIERAIRRRRSVTDRDENQLVYCPAGSPTGWCGYLEGHAGPHWFPL